MAVKYSASSSPRRILPIQFCHFDALILIGVERRGCLTEKDARTVPAFRRFALTPLPSKSTGIRNMLKSYLPRCGIPCVWLVFGLLGCSQGDTPSHSLDQDLARTSIQKAMQSWVDGKTPKDLQPEIVVGDPDWQQGKKLVSFEIEQDKETSDGSNLHIVVKQKFDESDSDVTYIVGTSPVVTIFPQ